ncbi:hypothetical protein BD779DRAFT_301973 [Infundibulicybe gibba]|nr:hypothetical protein BD779DRAFT_301973 [Infundibulicybe gibba]
MGTRSQTSSRRGKASNRVLVSAAMLIILLDRTGRLNYTSWSPPFVNYVQSRTGPSVGWLSATWSPSTSR